MHKRKAKSKGAKPLAAAALVAASALVPGVFTGIVGVVCSVTSVLVVAAAASRMSAAARPTSTIPVERDETYRPKVSVLVTSKDEPASVVIKSVAALRKLDYPNYEVIVINSNSTDRDNYESIERYVDSCPDTFHFVHVDHVHGFKAGALNYLNQHCVSDDSVLEAIVDCDYLVDPDFLTRTVGYFRDERVGLVQAPQDYCGVNERIAGLYYEYRSFFSMAMHQAQRNGLVSFTGTMGLVRTSLMREQASWSEDCITEDAAAGININSHGSIGVYVDESLGKGFMPFDYGNLMKQRRRWVYGNMQVLAENAWPVLTNRTLDARQKAAFFAQVSAWFQPELVVAGLSTLCFALWHVTGSLPFELFGTMMLDLLTISLLTSLVTFFVGLRHDASLKERFQALLARYGLLSVMSTGWLMRLLGYPMGFSVTKKVPDQHVRTLVPRTQLVIAALLVACTLLAPQQPGVAWRSVPALITAALALVAIPFSNRQFDAARTRSHATPSDARLVERVPAPVAAEDKDADGR